jgi:hypothetical protein
MAVAAADAAEPLELEHLKSGLRKQREKITSLHIRVRRKTTISVEPDVLVGWTHNLSLPEHLGTDEVLFAFKGHKRYHRIVALDYAPIVGPDHAPTALGRPSTKTPKWLLPYVGKVKLYTIDAAVACGLDTFFERKRDLESPGLDRPYRYRSVPLDDVRDSLPPPEYLVNVGLAVPDPTATDQAERYQHQMGILPDLFERRPYALSKQSEEVDGTTCAALEANFVCAFSAGDVSQKKHIRDKLWLDLEHGLALRKRETWVEGQLRRVSNSDFEELLPGVWLPRWSRTEIFAPPDSPKRYHDRPVCIRDTRLCLWVVNQTPDDLFDTALVEPGRVTPLDLVPAYHYRTDWVPNNEVGSSGGVTEIWAVKGVGWRRESRNGSKLQSLDVDTGRWVFAWEPARNRVRALPSLGDTVPDHPWVIDRTTLIRESEQMTGLFACQEERLDGKKVDKLTVHFPAERRSDGGRNNIHNFFSKVQLAASGMEFCTRQHWFDPKTGLRVQFRCGCKPAGYRVTLDYPSPESMPRKLFTFDVPPDALLEVDDPALGRRLNSKGQAEPSSGQREKENSP